MLIIDNAYTFGDMVYVKTDPQQLPGMIVGIVTYGREDVIQYVVKVGPSQAEFFDYELSVEKKLDLT
jgi:hypothetical protein